MQFALIIAPCCIRGVQHRRRFLGYPCPVAIIPIRYRRRSLYVSSQYYLER